MKLFALGFSLNSLAFGLSVDFSDDKEPEELGDSIGRFDAEEAAEFSEFLEMELPGHPEEFSDFALSESRPSLPSMKLGFTGGGASSKPDTDSSDGFLKREAPRNLLFLCSPSWLSFLMLFPATGKSLDGSSDIS